MLFYFIIPLFITKSLAVNQDKKDRARYVIGCFGLNELTANPITKSALWWKVQINMLDIFAHCRHYVYIIVLTLE